MEQKYLTIKEVAALYGENIKCKLLSPDGDSWSEIKTRVNFDTLREIENRSIKDCYKLINK